jgi:hypothetical protein
LPGETSKTPGGPLWRAAFDNQQLTKTDEQASFIWKLLAQFERLGLDLKSEIHPLHEVANDSIDDQACNCRARYTLSLDYLTRIMHQRKKIIVLRLAE